MSKSKRFQSGREIFQKYIPGFEEECLIEGDNDIECQSNNLIDVILSDFGRKVDRAVTQPARRNA